VEKFTNAWPSAEVSRNLVGRSDLLAEEDLSRSMRDLGQTKILPNTPLELLHSAIMVGCSCGSKYLKLKRHCIWSLHTQLPLATLRQRSWLINDCESMKMMRTSYPLFSRFSPLGLHFFFVVS
jgi:hypothetical protein